MSSRHSDAFDLPYGVTAPRGMQIGAWNEDPSIC